MTRQQCTLSNVLHSRECTRVWCESELVKKRFTHRGLNWVTVAKKETGLFQNLIITEPVAQAACVHFLFTNV